MGWKKWSYARRGGIIGISSAILLNIIYWSVYLFIGNPNNILAALNFPFTITSDKIVALASDIYLSITGGTYCLIYGWVTILASLILWFIMGIAIGGVIGKIKSRTREKKQKNGTKQKPKK